MDLVQTQLVVEVEEGPATQYPEVGRVRPQRLHVHVLQEVQRVFPAGTAVKGQTTVARPEPTNSGQVSYSYFD